MSFDVAAVLRRLKPEKKTSTLARRGDEELAFVDQRVFAGPPLLIETTVYKCRFRDNPGIMARAWSFALNILRKNRVTNVAAPSASITSWHIRKFDQR